MLCLGLADHTVAQGGHETQYRSHVSWWMRPRLQCQPTQRSPTAGTNHSVAAPLSTRANTTNGAIYKHGLAGCSWSRLSLPLWDLCTGRRCFWGFMQKGGSERTSSDASPISTLEKRSITFKYWHQEMITVPFCAAPFTFLSWPALNQLTATCNNQGNSERAPEFFLTASFF